MVGKHAFRSTLMIVMSVLGCTAALWAQPQPGDPNINSAADHLNQFAPQAVPQQTIKIGTFDGSNKNFYWDLPVVQIQGWKGPADDGESDPAGGPHQALINSYNVKYEIGLSHKPDNLQVKLFAYDSSAKLVEQQATVNVAGDKATITFNPHSTAAQVIKMTWSGGGQKNVQFYPKLQPQLGAFVVPHLLVAIVYEPPGGKSYASYTRTASVGTVVSWGFARTSGMVETVNPDEMTNMFVEGMSAAVSALGAETAGKVITELNNLKESTTTTTTTSNTSSEDHGNGTFVSLSEEAGTTAHLFPGQGDVFVVLNDVLFMYVVDGGKVKLAPMAYSHPRKLIASELQQQVPSAVAAKYIAFDPMISSNGEVDSKPVKGGLNPKLPGKLNTAQPRFKRFDTWVCEKNAYGEYELRQSEFTSTGTSNTTTETVLTHVTGLAASIDGGGDEFYGVTYSNSKQQTTGDEVVATVHLECGADEQAFEVEVYYDTVFRTFMCKKGQALATQSAMMGTAQDDQGQPLPGKKVSFEVGDHRYSVISDSQGNFKFPFNGMPQGAGTLSLDKASMPITYSGTALKNVKLSVARGSLLASAKGAPKGVGTPGGAAHGGKGNTPVQTSRPSASEGDTASAIRGTPPPPPPPGNHPGNSPGGQGSGSKIDLPGTIGHTAADTQNLAILLARLDQMDKRLGELSARISALEGGESNKAKPTGSGDSAKPSLPGANGQAKVPSAFQSSSAFEIVPSADLKGRLGRIVVVFPKDADASSARVGVVKSGDDKKEVIYAHGGLSAELMAGVYSLTISGKRIDGVQVQPGHDTRVFVGVLRVQAGSGTRVGVFEPGGKTELIYAHGAYDFGLPAGQYEVDVAGQRETVTVKANEITNF